MSDIVDSKLESWVVSYKQLGIVALSFSLGVTTAFLFANSQQGSSTSFTTNELIGFVLSVILSGASTVLAVVAISLGKTSELAMTRRSDESIRLQNEVFIRTTEALQRIESSTGVTEKRIEDIISGRVGAISQQLAEIATKDGKGGVYDTRELEERIRESLLNTIHSVSPNVEDLSRQKQNRESRDKREKLYQEAHEKIMYSVANLEGVSIEKIGHGNIASSGNGLFDGIYKDGKGKRFAVSTFREHTLMPAVVAYMNKAATEIAKENISSVYLYKFVSEESAENHKSWLKEIKDLQSMLKETVSANIHVLFVTYDEADKAGSFVKI